MSVDELMELKGYLRFGIDTETIGAKDNTNETTSDCTQTLEQGKQFLISKFSLSDEDQGEEDDEHIYIPSIAAQEFWESLSSFIQMAVFTLGKGRSADEMATLSKRTMLSAIQALPKMFLKLRDQIMAGNNPPLMCTLYYVYFDHELPKSAMSLCKVSLGAKQISYICESIKAAIESLVETSVTKGLERKLNGNHRQRY